MSTTNHFRSFFLDRIRRLSRQCVMTVQDLINKAGGVTRLAELCGVSHSTVCDWNRDNKLPGHRVPQISELLSVPPIRLMPLVRAWPGRAE